MKLIKKSEGERYDADRHFGAWSFRKLLAGADTRQLTVSISHFLPDGGVEMSSSPTEKFYYVVRGSMVVRSESEEHVLEEGDGIYIAPSEDREIRTRGDEPCTVLAVIVRTN